MTKKFVKELKQLEESLIPLSYEEIVRFAKDNNTQNTFSYEEMVMIAKDNNTPSGILARLAKEKGISEENELVLKFYLTLNTNTPTEVLHELIGLGDEFQYNIILNPRVESATLLAISNKIITEDKLSPIKLDILKIIAGHKKINQEIFDSFFNLDYTSDIFEALRWKGIYNSIAENPCSTDVILNMCFEKQHILDHHFYAHHISYGSVIYKILKNPNCPNSIKTLLESYENSNPEHLVLDRLSLNGSSLQREYVASYKYTPYKILDRMVNDKNPHVRWLISHRGLVDNYHMCPHILNKLAFDEDYGVRCNVAANPHSSPETLEFLALDEDYGEPVCVARNPNTPVNILELLSSHDNPIVRKYVAKHSKTPKNVLKQMLENIESSVYPAEVDKYFYLAYNKNVIEETIRQNPNYYR